jgi:hypothetical protein
MTGDKFHPQLDKDPEDHATKVADPYDLSNLRLNQSFVELAAVKKLLTSVPVRKPNPQDFIRVHPDPQYRAALVIIELRDDRETYLVRPSIARDLPNEFIWRTFTRRSTGRALCSFGRFDFRRRTVGFSNGTDQRRKRPNWRCGNGFASKPTWRSALMKYSRLRALFLIPSGQNSRFKNCSGSHSAIGSSIASTIP